MVSRSLRPQRIRKAGGVLGRDPGEEEEAGNGGAGAGGVCSVALSVTHPACGYTWAGRGAG